MNVLLTSVGRRSYLIDYFRNALTGSEEVLAANSLTDVPGMFHADHAFTVTPFCEPGYVDEIIAICRQYQVGLLCSCHDLDSVVLASCHEVLQKEGYWPLSPIPTGQEFALISLNAGSCCRETDSACRGVALSCRMF